MADNEGGLWYKTFLLKDDPFPLLPPSRGNPIIWAGLNEFKEDLIDAIKEALRTTPTKTMLIYGGWGSGKTHAMIYFSTDANLKEINRDEKILPIPIVLKAGGGVFNHIHGSIVTSIGMETIKKAATTLRSQIIEGKEASSGVILNEFMNIVNDPYLARVLSKIASSTEFETEKIYAAEKYLFGTAGSSDLKELEVPFGPTSDSDIFRIDVGLFRLLTYKKEYGNGLFSKIMVWFDQLENISDYNGKDIKSVNFYIRSLMDEIPSNMIIFLNFSLRSGQGLNDIMSYIDDSVISRINKKIEIKPFENKEDVFSYVDELINNELYRTKEDFEKLKKDKLIYFPFDMKALEKSKEFVENEGNLCYPRWINIVLSNLLSLSLKDKKLVEALEKQKTLIGEEFLESNRVELIQGMPFSRPKE